MHYKSRKKIKKNRKKLITILKKSKADLIDLLNYYNGEPVEIDGTMHHTYNDPVLGSKLNDRYKELTAEQEEYLNSWKL